MIPDATSPGRHYWRSLEAKTDSPEFRRWVESEFPEQAQLLDNAWSRRKFLTLMGASLALAGLAGCRRPVEKIVPFVSPPDNTIPGIPEQFATTMPDGNDALGLLVESCDGRPTKIEGNELHPSTQGRSNVRAQAAILDLYDPDRSQSVRDNGSTSTWPEFVSAWSQIAERHRATGGSGLAVISEPFSSPSLAGLKKELLRQFPAATWVAWEPVSDENIHLGIALAAGKLLQPVHHFDQADVILSLDSDFLLTERGNIRAANGFAAGRKLDSERDTMNRLYMVESLYSITGAAADHRLPLSGDRIPDFLRALAVQLRKEGIAVRPDITAAAGDLPQTAREWLAPLAADLVRARGKSLIVAGRTQPPALHALVLALNSALGNIDRTVSYATPHDSEFSSTEGLSAVTTAMAAGKISTVAILGGNPVYNAPADLNFRTALKNVETSIHLSSHVDETSTECTWHIPRAHFLESWGDTRSADGTIGMTQPLIAPLYAGKSAIEVTALMASSSETSGHRLVMQTWRQCSAIASGTAWEQALHDGVVPDTAYTAERPAINTTAVAAALNALPAPAGGSQLSALFHPGRSLHDGASANNGWLQELPDPITKLTWDNAATVSPATAAALGIENEDEVRVQHGETELVLPAWIVPGQADGIVGLALGYGRTHSGRVGNHVGANTYTLRSTGALYYGAAVTITATGRRHPLANTQDHGSMEGRPIVREASLEGYRQHPHFAPEAVEHPPLKSLWADRPYDQGHQWGMAIDLTTCTGCNTCTIACQSENNIPIVGKDETRRGREMHWIRIDRYFAGDTADPEIVHMPVACHHCENAPCEQVCPVAATVHDAEGLNAMVYNRCVGTRYCANNCPYKVRRFNFYNLTGDMPEIVKMAQNPDVTVRSRGVMEKCSYCHQRLVEAKRAAKLDDRELRDGEVRTACQQACPSNAIVFGDINDPNSEVTRIKAQNRSYDLLAELNIKPRTSYLAKVRNPNPELSR